MFSYHPKLLAKSIYRVKYHPLAKYPGPLLAKLTNLYGAYHALRGDLHLDMQQCHEEYGMGLSKIDHTFPIDSVIGGIVRYGPDRVLMDSPNALHGSPSALYRRTIAI